MIVHHISFWGKSYAQKNMPKKIMIFLNFHFVQNKDFRM